MSAESRVGHGARVGRGESAAGRVQRRASGLESLGGYVGARAAKDVRVGEALRRAGRRGARPLPCGLRGKYHLSTGPQWRRQVEVPLDAHGTHALRQGHHSCLPAGRVRFY